MSAMIESTFQPSRWLKNPHVQSILASSGLRTGRARKQYPALHQHATSRIIDCGNGVRLSGLMAKQPGHSRGLAFLIHGWEGSAQSSYLQSTGGRLFDDGFDVFRLNLRDHGDSHHLNVDLFHSCRLDEVITAALAIRGEFAGRKALIGGFSLGGNFALRIARATDTAFQFVFSICPPLVPKKSLEAIELAPWFYRYYFMRKWRESLQLKQRLFPERFDFRSWQSLNMRDLTRVLIEQETDFPSVDAYLDGYSIGLDRLLELRCPSLVVAAQDDPVIPVADFHELLRPSNMQLEILPHGGHCGFLTNLSMESWAEARIARALKELQWL